MQAQNNIKNKYLGPDAPAILSPALTLIEVQNEIRRLIRLEEELDPDGGDNGDNGDGEETGSKPFSVDTTTAMDEIMN